MKNKQYIKISNADVFNQNQDSLVTILNNRIREDYKKYLSDPEVKYCLTEIDSIPLYNINDFRISFQDNEIKFGVEWGLTGACRSVNGSAVSFKLSEIKKYLK